MSFWVDAALESYTVEVSYNTTPGSLFVPYSQTDVPITSTELIQSIPSFNCTQIKRVRVKYTKGEVDGFSLHAVTECCIPIPPPVAPPVLPPIVPPPLQCAGAQPTPTAVCQDGKWTLVNTVVEGNLVIDSGSVVIADNVTINGNLTLSGACQLLWLTVFFFCCSDGLNFICR
jgi:hypothetical protein